MIVPSTPEAVARVVRQQPNRVVVAGVSGSGKSTLAERLGQELKLPYTEIDALFHGPGWTPRPAFEADVLRVIAQPRWVTEWQYSLVRPKLLERADVMIWLDLPRVVQMRQLVRRTTLRRLRRQELWNGNTEPPLHTVFTDPDHIIRWGWRTHATMRDKVQAAAQARPELPIVRVRSRRDLDAVIDALRVAGQAGSERSIP